MREVRFFSRVLSLAWYSDAALATRFLGPDACAANQLRGCALAQLCPPMRTGVARNGLGTHDISSGVLVS
jgi:hypothetical protein